MHGDAQPGDDIVPDANMVFDRERSIAAPPEAIWPWLTQLGKGRAGWYLPRSVERLVPRGRRALRWTDARWRRLEIGDRIPDYGGKGAELEVVEVAEPRLLIHRDERRGAKFSWAITLSPAPDGRMTVVHLRFRGRIQSTGLKRRVIVAGAELFDGLTAEGMLRGLDERVREAVAGRPARAACDDRVA